MKSLLRISTFQPIDYQQKAPTLANWGFVAREGHDPI